MKSKKLVMNVNFSDGMGLHGDSTGPEDVEKLVVRCDVFLQKKHNTTNVNK